MSHSPHAATRLVFLVQFYIVIIDHIISKSVFQRVATQIAQKMLHIGDNVAHWVQPAYHTWLFWTFDRFSFRRSYFVHKKSNSPRYNVMKVIILTDFFYYFRWKLSTCCFFIPFDSNKYSMRLKQAYYCIYFII